MHHTGAACADETAGTCSVILCLRPGSAGNAMQQFNFRRKDARVSTLLTQAGADIGVTDLLVLIGDQPPA